jgi:hypothetical protein
MGNLRTKLLKATDDAKKVIATPFTVKKEKKQLESWILDREQKDAELQEEINELKSADKMDVDAILDKIDELELNNRRLKQGEGLLNELFIEDVKEEE